MKNVDYRKILITHDGSKFASIAFSYALPFATCCSSDVLLVRVIAPIGQTSALIDPVGMAPIPVSSEDIEKTILLERKLAKEEMKRLKAELEGAGARKVETFILEGLPGEEIIKFAKENSPDIIVMSTHGRSGISRILLGSVADYVVRNAPCPVLVVRPNKK